MPGYEVWYYGARYVGDIDNYWNSANFGKAYFKEAMYEYQALKEEGFKCYLKDVEYDVCYEDGEWY